MVYSPAFIFSSVYPLGFCRVPGFALGRCVGFKPFWPLALAQLSLVAIILQALRRLGGAVLFRGLRPSSIQQFLFWLLGLTVQSSRPAFGGRLTFVRYAARDGYESPDRFRKQQCLSFDARRSRDFGRCQLGGKSRQGSSRQRNYLQFFGQFKAGYRL